MQPLSPLCYSSKLALSFVSCLWWLISTSSYSNKRPLKPYKSQQVPCINFDGQGPTRLMNNVRRNQF